MKNKKIMEYIIFAVVLLIPVIYSFFYLKSYWDPYGNLSDMKIAVVNLDEGKDEENQGEEFVAKLKDSDTFNICEVSLDEANEGMQQNEYYAMITIPSNFTEYLESASTENKNVATITYNPNQASNYLATQIVNSAMKTVEADLQAEVDSKIVANLSEKLEEVPNSLNDISDGASQILNGSEDLNSGLKQIKNGTSELNSKYSEFDKGVSSAYDGSTSIDNGLKTAQAGVNSLATGTESLDGAIEQINSGIDELSTQGNQGIAALSTGIQDLYNGANGLNTGVSGYLEGTASYAENVSNYTSNVEKYTKNVKNYISSVDGANEKTTELLTKLSKMTDSDDENIKELAKSAQTLLTTSSNLDKTEIVLNKTAEGLNQSGVKISKAGEGLVTKGEDVKNGAEGVLAGTQELATKSSSLSGITEGITSLKNAMAQVKVGTTSLKSGVNKLSNGTTELLTGSTQLTSGLSTLDESSTQVKSALQTLDDGANSAYDGSDELTSGVQEFNDEVNSGISDTNEELTTLNGLEEFSKEPVNMETEGYGDVSSYGIAFTPLFLCIGLWVGALMCYVVFYYDQRHRFGILDHDNKNKLVQNIIYLIVGGIQGILTAGLLKLGLGFEIQNMWLYFGVSALLGVTFISIIQFLIRNFGDIGKFLALIILVLQLAASGGTFPIETINEFFQVLSPYLPMTYAINLLREILIPTATNFKAEYIGLLLGINVAMVGITYCVDIIKIKLKKTKKSTNKSKIGVLRKA